MKTIMTSKLTVAVTLTVLLFGMGFYTSCTKDMEECGTSRVINKETPNELEKQAIVKFLKSMPEVKVVAGDKTYTMSKSLNSDGFSFADPSPGYDFTTSSNIEFVDDGEGGVILVSASNSGGGGGTVVAGTSSLDITAAFCFSAEDDASGFMIGGASSDSSSSGTSMVIGISGDFEALANGEVDTTAEITDYFWGFAMYVVFEDEASGSYDVIDFSTGDPDELDGKAISLVFDFVNGKAYISSSGQLNVETSSIGFSGNYFELDFNIFGEESEEEPDFEEVSGFGTMGCQ